KGVSPTAVLFRHALRPSASSLVTLAGLSLGSLIGGAVIVEIRVAPPVISAPILNWINLRDIPLVQGVVMFTALIYVTLNTLIDISYHVIDPRLRSQER